MINKTSIVILCGGSGSRLNPLTNKENPKQFLPIHGSSLFHQTYTRACRAKKQLKLNNIYIITTKDYIDEVVLYTQSSKTDSRPHIIIEPASKNTFYPMIASSILIGDKKKNHSLLFLPCDHLILNEKLFLQSIKQAQVMSNNSDIVIFGKQPTFVSKDYGYIKTFPNSSKVSEFIEKPDLKNANKIIASGAFWNAGMALVNTDELNNILYKKYPTLVQKLLSPLVISKNNITKIAPSVYKNIVKKSFDKEILTKHTSLDISIRMTELRSDWSDLGSWESLVRFFIKYEKSPKFRKQYSNNDNSLNNNKLSINFITNKKAKTYFLLTDKYLFHGHYDKGFSYLEEKIKKINSRENFLHRPWGLHKTIFNCKKYKIKILELEPHQSISLQYHNHRDENWLILAGQGIVTINTKLRNVSTYDQVEIKKSERHRIKNIGSDKLVILELQSGAKLVENDIVRINDDYGRC